jgi:hypothetical protein
LAGQITIHAEPTLRRLVRAVEEDRPIAEVIPTAGSLERWRQDLSALATAMAPTITPETAERLIDTQPEMEWRIRPWRFPFFDEVQVKVSEYVHAGVPPQWIRIIWFPDEEMWGFMVATETPPGRAQVA